jgi:hypothetical protein
VKKYFADEELPEIIQTAAMKNIQKMKKEKTMKKLMNKYRKKSMMKLKYVHFRGKKIQKKKNLPLLHVQSDFFI